MADAHKLRRRVLVVDEDPSISATVSERLPGWEVRAAKTSEEAAALLSGWDAVVLGLTPATGTMGSFAEQVRQQLPDAGLMAMAVSEPRGAERWHDTFVIRPPTQRDHLAELIEQAIERRRIDRQLDMMKEKVSGYSTVPTPAPKRGR